MFASSYCFRYTPKLIPPQKFIFCYTLATGSLWTSLLVLKLSTLHPTIFLSSQHFVFKNTNVKPFSINQLYGSHRTLSTNPGSSDLCTMHGKEKRMGANFDACSFKNERSFCRSGKLSRSAVLQSRIFTVLIVWSVPNVYFIFFTLFMRMMSNPLSHKTI